MYFVIKPLTSCGSLSKSPATVFVSVAEVKFFAFFAHIRRLDVKALLVLIDHSGFVCGGFSENR